MESRALPNGRAAALGQALIVVATATALAASAALLVDYVRPAAVFCDDAGAGCARLRATAFASVLGVPTPAAGLGAFAIMAALALLRSPRARLAHLGLAAAGALIAAFLLSVQVRLATFCRFCIVVDVSAIVVFAGAMLRGRGEPIGAAGEGASEPGWLRRGGVPAFLLAIALPLLFGFTRPLPPRNDGSPDGLWGMVEREIKATPTGQVTVVDFVDYECPFCRMTHETLSPVLAEHAADIRLVRRQVPLRTIHPHAMDAAKAACCGEKLGIDKAMTEALFTAPVEELTPTGCEKLAVKSGADAAAFRACFADPAIAARVEAEIGEFKAAGGRSLPTVWIDETKFVGAQDGATFRRAIERALEAKKKTRG